MNKPPKTFDERMFSCTVAYLQSDLNAWKKCRKQADAETIEIYRKLFHCQIERLERLAKIGLTTSKSLRLIDRVRKYLTDM